uniref:UspA domain-containing protein n=1 Tax=Hemiselmis andersenii TaxID=464988 RepID=A0A6U4LMT2_HEMAN|mmetsp:Transcript_9351/g.21862  ORF Transcript_9351/g.21862 Transcript_9351/m.21862 type:complete len:331 (+) Transcript_9351:198-1190(+)|eukprot:CAMPEP_0114127794 /NCGR_PEP_ID=MMETSP0043_2-20121206/10584_1 /TAXON_ID=464988 /ORGANISM="Hemiselmis andersenii, Strain CCMP644" /LENGTH=330 /DNA_ID=CAMNT_0001220931 /DNA_START=2793 /DNA_END=3785 /DNA_ORIENTATION=-
MSTSSSNNRTRRWLVMVDGSAVSGKAFDACCSFINVQHTKGGIDDLTVMHGVDPKSDAEKPFHLRGARILSSYESNFIKAKRNYDASGKGHMETRVISQTFDGSGPQIPVAQLEWARGAGTTEVAPPIIASLLEATSKQVHPDFVFMGSFGTGGKKVGANGSVTDYLIRLLNSTVCVIKHWRPVPKPEEPATFVVAVDDSPASLKSLEQILVLAKKSDKIVGVTVSRHKGPKDDKIIEEASKVISAHSGVDSPHINVSWKPLVEGSGTAAEVLINAGEELEADYLVIGSVNTAHGAKNRDNICILGSTALYVCSHSKCHTIIVKPPVNDD